jgi:hypothetical protein
MTTTDTIGGTAHDLNADNELLYTSLTPSASGILDTVGANIKSTGGSVRLALYSTLIGGIASGLLWSSGFVSAVLGWIDLAVAPTVIPITIATPVYPALIGGGGFCDVYWDSPGAPGTYDKYPSPGFADPTPSSSFNSGLVPNMRITYHAAPAVIRQAIIATAGI